MSPALSVIDDALIIKYSGAWGNIVQLILIFQRFEQDRLILGHVRDPLRNAPAKWTLVGVMKEVGVSASHAIQSALCRDLADARGARDSPPV